MIYADGFLNLISGFLLFLFQGDETGAVDHEDCEAGGDEECLMRRTLAAAHSDYIYTHPGPP